MTIYRTSPMYRRGPPVPPAVDRLAMTTEARASPDVPDWDDEYIDRVSDRLLHNYDLEKDYEVDRQVFDLYGEMRMRSEKHFFHPALSYAHHRSTEHLFVKRDDGVTLADVEALVDLGHDLADEWIEIDDEHFSTEFIFTVVAEDVPADVDAFVADFSERTLLKYGMNGHYEIHLVVVSPETKTLVASENAEVEQAFRLWDPIETSDPSWWQLFTRRMQM